MAEGYFWGNLPTEERRELEWVWFQPVWITPVGWWQSRLLILNAVWAVLLIPAWHCLKFPAFFTTSAARLVLNKMLRCRLPLQTGTWAWKDADTYPILDRYKCHLQVVFLLSYWTHLFIDPYPLIPSCRASCGVYCLDSNIGFSANWLGCFEQVIEWLWALISSSK